MNRRVFAVLAIFAISTTAASSQDVIVRMNETMTDVLKLDMTFQNPGMASRTQAMMNLAMYDAINAISAEHDTFYSHPSAPSNALADAAALEAGYQVLTSIYPDMQSRLDSDRAAILATLPSAAATTAGLQFGENVAATIISDRETDGFANMVSYMPTNAPGHWQPDPLNPSQVAWGPEWGKIRTFAIPGSASFMPEQMPELNSQEYTNAFNEVKTLGSKNSTTRTADQTEAALFWAYDRNGMGTPIRMYNQVLRNIASDQGNSLGENARLFAAASTSMADAGIVAWDSKFEFDFWRPVSGIREADTDGNPDTVADLDWTPLGAPGGFAPDGSTIDDFTPPFPTYVSGHASFGGALFASLEAFYGTDEISFDVTSEELPGVVRNFSSFSEAMEENGRSRVYLGIHWDFDDSMARELGSNVAQSVATTHFRPVPEPSGFLIISLGFLALLGRRRRRLG